MNQEKDLRSDSFGSKLP